MLKVYLKDDASADKDRYDDCIAYCEKIIGGGYTLATNYLHNFMADNNTNSATNEIIFPIISDGVTTQNYGPTTVIINGAVGSLELTELKLVLVMLDGRCPACKKTIC